MKIMFIIYIPQTHTQISKKKAHQSSAEILNGKKKLRMRKTVHVRKREVSEWCVSTCIYVWLMPLSPSDYHA